ASVLSPFSSSIEANMVPVAYRKLGFVIRMRTVPIHEPFLPLAFGFLSQACQRCYAHAISRFRSSETTFEQSPRSMLLQPATATLQLHAGLTSLQRGDGLVEALFVHIAAKDVEDSDLQAVVATNASLFDKKVLPRQETCAHIPLAHLVRWLVLHTVALHPIVLALYTVVLARGEDGSHRRACAVRERLSVMNPGGVLPPPIAQAPAKCAPARLVQIH